MSISAVNHSYHQIVESDLIQTTIQAIQSLVDRIFINPSNVCLLGHALVMNYIVSLVEATLQPGSLLYCLILAESSFILVQQGRNLYEYIQSS